MIGQVVILALALDIDICGSPWIMPLAAPDSDQA